MIYTLQTSQTIALPRDRVFPFFADAANLGRITPPELRFCILTPLPIRMGEGALIEYRLRLFGVSFSWRTRISSWEPDSRFVDEQVDGPYTLWEHTHSFEDVDGGTEVRDVVRYQLPLGAFGRCAHPIVRRQLDRIFRYRQRRVSELLGG